MPLPPSPLVVAIITILVGSASASLIFQPTQAFAAIQLKLTTTTGFISQASGSSFSFPNPGYSNFNSLGIALCGYDLPAQANVQFKADLSYDGNANSFLILVLATNQTTFYSLNYYLLIATSLASSYIQIQDVCLQPPSIVTNPTIYNRTHYYSQVNSPFATNATSSLKILPFLRSLYSVTWGAYNYYNVTTASQGPGSTTVQIQVFLNYSMVSEVCLTILFYEETLAAFNPLYYNASATLANVLSSALPNSNLASNSQFNFTMNRLYGPNWSPKCVVGFQAVSWDVSARQTMSFNLTGAGIFNLIASSHYNIDYNTFCLAQIICSSPLQQYYPLINQCQPICTLLNCSVCSTSTSCMTCDPGYYLNTLYRCDPCIANCQTCLSPTGCSTCLPGYVFNSGTGSCTQCPQFCTSCLASRCLTCIAGYLPSGNQCLLCSVVMAQCLECTTATYCTKCPSHTIYAGSSQGCVNCDSRLMGCLTCSHLYRCTSCQNGFYLSGVSCIQCSPGAAPCCSFYNPNCVSCRSSTCTDCQVNYYLTSNSSCALCSDFLANCSTCSNSSICLSCQDSFFLQTNTSCRSCSSVISNCLSCSNGSYCLSCSLPFLSVQGICYHCPIWPLENLYYLDSNNSCQSCSLVTDFCIRCSDAATCTQCQDLYYLSVNGTCQSCGGQLTNCLACKSNSSCGVCTHGYYPNWLSPSECLLCNQTIADCLSCQSIFYPADNSHVLACSVCQPEFFINGSICSPCSDAIPFCLTCFSNYQCSLCSQGYYLSTTLLCIPCQELIQGCEACNSSSVCSKCQWGYYLINAYCTQCLMAINHCQSCTLATGPLTCQSCVQGYHLGLNFTCLSCNATLLFCQACSNQLTCTSCISGYLVNYNHTCQPCSSLLPFCTYCVGLKCSQCQTNYILDAFGDCLSCDFFIPGCHLCHYPPTNASNLTFHQLNCTACMPGFLLYDPGTNWTKCLSCNASIFYCSSCASLTTCNTCQNISFRNNESKCSLCSLYLPNCLYCSSATACSGCNSGFYLAPNATCISCDPAQFGFHQLATICLVCIYQGASPICTSCRQGFFQLNGNCSSCSSSIPHCNLCTSPSLCVLCQDYYYASAFNNECLPCLSSLTYCTSCVANGTCLACRSDCYLNSTLNQCFLCSSFVPDCFSCSLATSVTIGCNTCQEGFYLSGGQCLSCQEAMSDCVLCSDASTCLVTNQSSSTSSIIWLIISIICLLIFIILLICLFRLWSSRKKEEKETEPSLSQRQMVNQDLMYNSQPSQVNQKITKCIYCNQNPPAYMSVELLCGNCKKKDHRGNNHHIKKSVKGAGRRNQHVVLTESDDIDMQPPPPSMINPHQMVKVPQQTKSQMQIPAKAQPGTFHSIPPQ